MALASVKTLGATQSKAANQASLVHTVTGSAAANSFLVAIIAVDNNATVNGDEGAISLVLDSAGNTWTKAVEFTNAQGAAQAGATCGIWYSNTTAVLTATVSTITVNFTNAASRDASAISIWQFSKGTNTEGSQAATATTLANTNLDPGSLNVTTSNETLLRIRGIAAETSTVTALTPTATWTAFDGNQTTGGASATNMAVRGEFVISTGTGNASDPTYTAADCASCYVVFREVSTWIYSGTGGITSGGNSVTLKIKSTAATGGLTYSGASLKSKERIYLVSGGVNYSGISTPAKVKNYTPSGGISHSGIATTSYQVGLVIRTYTASGGINYAGASISTKEKNYRSTGGLALIGGANLSKFKNYSSAGGIVYSGVINSSKEKVYTTVGGVSFAGKILISFEKIYPVSNGINLSGNANLRKEKSFIPTGGLHLLGNALTIKIKIPKVSGGITTSGKAEYLKIKLFESSGRVNLSGNANTAYWSGIGTVHVYNSFGGLIYSGLANIYKVTGYPDKDIQKLNNEILITLNNESSIILNNEILTTLDNTSSTLNLSIDPIIEAST